MHRRIHPIYTDGFLASLDQQPKDHPVNDPTLAVSLVLQIEGQTGRVLRRGIIRTSGVTAFDINALVAVDRAAPFDPPPPGIVWSDGNVQIQWTFRRDQMACSPSQAKLFP